MDPVSATLAGASIASSIGNTIAQGSMNKKTRQWNEKMYNLQRADALADWQRQNAYNSPAAQMERFKQAGLNPNLIYGKGDSGSASPVQQSKVLPYNPKDLNIGGGLDFYDMATKGAQLDILNEKKRQENLNTHILQKDAINRGIPLDRNGKPLFKNLDREADFNPRYLYEDLERQEVIAGLDQAKETLDKTKTDNMLGKQKYDFLKRANPKTLKQADQVLLNMIENNKILQSRLKGIDLDNAVKEVNAYIAEEFNLRPSDPLWAVGAAALFEAIEKGEINLDNGIGPALLMGMSIITKRFKSMKRKPKKLKNSDGNNSETIQAPSWNSSRTGG